MKLTEPLSPLKPSSVNALAKEIQTRFNALPALRVQDVRALRREFSKRLMMAEADFVLELAFKLCSLPGFDFRFIGYELVQHHRAATASLDAPTLEKLGKGINTWPAVDCFASYLSGPAWREQQVSNSVIQRWAKSSDRWWRRAAIVSTVPLNNKARGGTGDAPRTLLICKMLVADRDDMVVKALSWALRELSKRDPRAVAKFMRDHGNNLAPRVIREVNNKLKTGLKNPH